MSQASEIISSQVGSGINIQRTWGSVIYNVKDPQYGAKGDGVTDDTTKIASAISAASIAGGIVFFPPGTFIAGNITVPGNVTLWFANGAKISVNSGYTVTINGPIDTGMHQIFSGTGTVTINSPISGYPHWFGAKGDGANDDTDAFKKALSSGMSRINAPEGTYKIRQGEIILGVGQSIVGDGIRSTGFYIPGTNSTGITLNGLGASVSNFQVYGDGTATSGAGIVAKASNTTINNVFVQNTYDGILVGGIGSTVTTVFIQQILIETVFNTGLFLQNVNDVFLDQFIINAGVQTPLSGIRLVGKVEAFTASNGDVLNFSFSMSTDTGSNTPGSRPAYCKFSQVYFDTAANGVLLDKIVDFKFTKCWFSNRPGPGCTLNTADSVVFEDCDFVNNGSHGLLVQSTAKSVRIRGGSAISNNQQNNGSNGITIAANTTDFIVQGVVAKNGLGFAGVQGYGIFVAAGTSDRYIIADNLVSGNGAGGVTDAGTGTNKRVANNY